MYVVAIARMSKRKATCLASCLALAILGNAALAPQALADRSDCPSQFLCVWDGPTYGGERKQFHDNGWQNLTNFGFNDRTSSVYNNTNRYAQLSEHINGGGPRLCLFPGGYMSLSGTYWDNKASSVWLGTSSCAGGG